MLSFNFRLQNKVYLTQFSIQVEDYDSKKFNMTDHATILLSFELLFDNNIIITYYNMMMIKKKIKKMCWP